MKNIRANNIIAKGIVIMKSVINSGILRWRLAVWFMIVLSMLVLGVAALSLAAEEHKGLSPLPEKVVVLTFDDSVRSHHSVVAPLLKKYGFSATFFITEGFDFRTNKDDYMTWEQIRELHEDGFEIGNHSRDHMSVMANTLGYLKEQLEAINQDCLKHGIPRPVSFAYPGNSFVLEALPVLQSMGIKYARRGGSPEYSYEEGGGVPYEPGKDHSLLIPSVGDARPNWTMEDFLNALKRKHPGTVPVLQFHGVPDRAHPWVHTPPEKFKKYMSYLKKEGYTVLALRDLGRYVDLKNQPKDPEAIIQQRVKSRESKR